MKIDFSVDEKEMRWLKQEVKEFIELLKKSARKIDADIFVGGSFAKGTLARSDEYDVDVFVRFDWKYKDLSRYLEKVLKQVVKGGKYKIDKLHGSRDYFRIYKDRKLTFEVIPVVRIKRVKEARNVTDLSYFHVNYLKRNLKKDMRKEILLAKKFCKGVGVYGAESYIGGFSGYGLECLIIHYKKFEKMLRELVKVEERIVLDPAKLYKRKDDVLIELNENKLHSPIVLVDPTWKERNVLAGLNMEAFRKFQEEARKYLRNPGENFFEVREFDVSKLEKKAKHKKGEFVRVVLETDRQEGDIAGTKMKKFSRFLVQELRKYFDILDSEFIYDLGKKSDFYFVAKSKKEIVRIGPPLDMKKDVKAFKRKNKKTFVRNGLLCVKIRIDFSAKEFLKKMDKKRVREMGIISLRSI